LLELLFYKGSEGFTSDVALHGSGEVDSQTRFIVREFSDGNRVGLPKSP